MAGRHTLRRVQVCAGRNSGMRRGAPRTRPRAGRGPYPLDRAHRGRRSSRPRRLLLIHAGPVDRVRLEGLELQAQIGVYDRERGVTQTLVISVSVERDLRLGGSSDLLADTIDYDRIAQVCRDVVNDRHHNLIEAVAERIADRLRKEYAAEAVDVRIEKPGAVPGCRTVAVEIRRTG